MSRRSRNSRAWRYVWSGIRRDADARALYSDSDSEAEYPAIVPPVPSAVPVTGESYCSCDSQMELSCNPRLRGYTHLRDCHCGEDDQGDFDWVWDEGSRSSATLLSCENRKVSFHSEYSCGTAAIRGSKELSEGQHFWEIKMTSPVYGTDMGSIIGVHLDTWHGTLTFYKNRKCIGVAATEMKNKRVFPMACSTAAKSSMKVIRSVSAPTSLQYLCCSRLRKLLPSGVDALRVLPLPPGLRHLLHSKLGWVLSLDHMHTHSNTHTPPGPSSGSDSEGCSSDPEACQRKRCRWT
ncbi:SPRY domain-containing SOCS box protein 3 [Labeo rohita]|uniref:SPRY domain-containing SOCS box protein 3 n=1 Tax=Labeo rohita TaxID=84645 RepID=A0ABQ8MU81_LABRO|nr:SPRY domain-containing SOCS box protein 3 [Labeo rohita]